MRTIRTTTIAILAIGLMAGSSAGAAGQDEPPAPIATTVTGAFTTRSDTVREGEGAVIGGVTTPPAWSSARAWFRATRD